MAHPLVMDLALLFKAALFVAFFCCLQAKADMGEAGFSHQGEAGLVVVVYITAIVLAGLSLVFALLGLVLAAQWPSPHCLCYNQHMADTASGRNCCSIYRTNMSLAILWLVFLVVNSLSRDFTAILLCLGFAMLHVLTLVLLRRKFAQHGFPDWHANSLANIPTAQPQDRSTLMSSIGPTPATGMPVYQIPMTTVVVGSDGRIQSVDCASTSQHNSATGTSPRLPNVGRPSEGQPVVAQPVSPQQPGNHVVDGVPIDVGTAQLLSYLQTQRTARPPSAARAQGANS